MKVVPTFECDVLIHQFRMLFQVRAQTGCVAGINEIYGAAKNRVFDSFMVREIQLIGERRLFDVLLKSRPALKTSLTSDSELCVTELQRRDKNFSVRGATETWMKFPDALGRSGVACGMFLQQVFGLMLEMIEVGIRGEASYGHAELPFIGPRSAFTGRK